MKVSELITELQKVDPDLEVHNFFVDCRYKLLNVEVVDRRIELGKICMCFGCKR